MGNKKEYTYKNGMLTEEKIPITSTESSIKFYEYDEIGNISAEGIKSSKTGELKKTSYEYDNMENNTKITTGNGSRDIKYEYNYRNQTTKIIYPSRKYETYKYNNIGNITEKTDRNGVVTKYTYDKRVRMTQVTEFTNPTNTFSSTKTKYSYNLNGNRTKTKYGNELTVEHVYNKAGMLTEMRNNKNGSNIEILKYNYNLF